MRATGSFTMFCIVLFTLAIAAGTASANETIYELNDSGYISLAKVTLQGSFLASAESYYTAPTAPAPEIRVQLSYTPGPLYCQYYMEIERNGSIILGKAQPNPLDATLPAVGAITYRLYGACGRMMGFQLIESGSFSVVVDGTPPSTPGSPVVASIGTTPPVFGERYLRTDGPSRSFLLTWPASTDGQSGVAGYTLSGLGFTPVPSLQLEAPREDGCYTFTVVAVDNVGNTSPGRSISLFVDNSGPERIAVAAADVVGVEPEGSDRAKVTVTWRPVPDLPAGTSQGYERSSGVNRYVVRVGSQTQTVQSGETTTTSFSSLARDTTYEVSITAYDNLDNPTTSTTTVAMPPSPVSIVDVRANPTIRSNDAEPVYRNTIVLDRPPAFFQSPEVRSTVDHYEILRSLKADPPPTTTDPGFPVLSYSPAQIAQWIAAAGTVSHAESDREALVGRTFAHRTISYRLKTVYKNGYVEYSSARPAVLANYESPFRVVAASGADDPGTTELSNVISSGPALYTNDVGSARIRLEPTSDIEGDAILLTAEYTRTGSSAPQSNATGDDIILEEILRSEGKGTISLTVTETSEGLTRAIHRGAFEVVYDMTSPSFSGSLYLGSPSAPKIVYDAARHAPIAAIEIRGLSANDDLGSAHSGVKALRIWNLVRGAPSGPPVEIAWNGAETNLAWSLERESEGEQSVVLEAIDRAGNAGRKSLTTFFDATPPEAPPVPWPSAPGYDQLHDAIHIDWSAFADNLTAVEDLAYEVTVTGAPPTTRHERSYEITAASSYPPNLPLELSVTAVDRAGNRSVPAIYDRLNAPAQVGKLQTAINLTYAGAHTYTLTWRTETASDGADELLRVSWFGSSGGVLIRDVHGSSGFFILEDVTPHRSLSYQLVAVNSCGFETLQFTGQPSTWTSYTLPNSPPAKPTLIGPTALSRLSPVFRWDFDGTEADRDGDPVTYTLCCRPAGGTGWPEASRITSGVPFLDSKDYPDRFSGLLIDEGRFDWMVLAADDRGATSESDAASCTVDGTPPEATLSPPTENGNPFTNARSLTASASDTHGVAAVLYSFDDTLDSAGNPIVVRATLTEVDGRTVATIPLHESHRDPSGEAGASYRVTVSTYDAAGNATTSTVGPMVVDFTAPVAPTITLTAPLYNGRQVSSTGRVPTRVATGDELSGVRELQYGFVESRSEVPDPWQDVTLSSLDPAGGTAGDEYLRVLEMSGGGRTAVSGSSYYLVARTVDWAGNACEAAVSGASVLIDISPPQASISMEGTTAYAGRFYLSNPSSLAVVPAVSDPETGVVAEYALVDQATYAVPTAWSSATTDLPGALRPGYTYRVALRATNGVGEQSIAYGRPFTYDPTPPTSLSIGGGPLTSLISGETVHVTAAASDPESGIRRFRLSIGSSPGGREVSRLIAGSVDGYLVEEACAASTEFVVTIPELSDGSYFVDLEATNGAGVSAHSVDSTVLLTVNNSQERLVVFSQSAFTSSPDGLRASWLYHGPRVPSGYRYRVVSSSGTIVRDWMTTDAAWVMAQGLELTHGGTYHFEVEASFAGAASILASGPDVTVDLSLPLFASGDGFVVPRASTSDGLRIGWDVTDPESGIIALEAVLSSYDGSMHLTIALPREETVEELLLSCDEEGRPLPLETGRKVLVSLRVTNGAGATIDRQSAAVMIDDTPPPVPVVVDQGDVINIAQHLSAQWIWTADDPESGTACYRWALLRDPGSVGGAEWHEAALQRGVDLSTIIGIDGEAIRTDKSQWYFAVEATNGSGLRSIGFSDGIIYDATAPHVVAVKLIADGGEPGGSPDIRYISSRVGLRLYVDAVEDVAQLLTFSVESGSLTSDGWTADPSAAVITSTEKTIPLEDPSLIEPGRVTIFRILCRNEAGLVSQYGYTQGVLLDPVPPLIEVINGRMARDELFFDWDCRPAVAPIESYHIALALSSQALPDPTRWKNVGTSRTAVFRKEEDGIADGRYVLFVKARSATGVESQPQRSTVVTFDTTPPTLSSLETPKYASTSASVTGTSSDPDSGISSYQYEVGTFEDSSCFSNGWIDLLHNGSLLTATVDLMSFSSDIPDGSTCRITVRSRNGAGLWNDPAMSRPITIDRTVAAKPQVSSPAYTTHRSRIEDVAFSAGDPQSGIRALRITAVMKIGEFVPSAAQLIMVGDDEHFVNPAFSEAFSLTGLELREEIRYYVALQAQNGAGDWSEVGYSDAILVDSIAPTISFEDGGDGVVINYGPAALQLSLSEAARVTMIVVAENGASTELPSFDATSGTNSFQFPMAREGVYRVQARAVDPAGNVGNADPDASSLVVRINAAPRIFFSGFETTPGKSLHLTGHVIDPDGDDPLDYAWSFGDGEATSEEAEPIHVYHHRSVADSSSHYTVTLTVTDALGKPSTETTEVTVHNTQAGVLYADEYWSGIHPMLGVVRVPAALSLTVVSGTSVEVADDCHLAIEGTLEVESGSLFAPAGSGSAWKGIIVSGVARIAGATIAGAGRGLTALAGSEVSLDSTDFTGNLVGLHAYGSRPAVANCRFEGSAQYGVKEDAGGEPLLSGCVFSANLYDYYDQQETVIETERLNELGGNSGNRHE